ncbi:MAG: hypothetical protein JW959_14730 [Pirellulales bacterium]|nr:hypothetical protein [Pirellulales bacterium]
MDCSLFANPPPRQFLTGVGVGILICALLIVVFLRRPGRSGRRRYLALTLLALICGPLLSAGICGIAVLCGAFYPMDRWFNFVAFVKVGIIVGVLGAILVGLLTSPLCKRGSK